jgi:ATP-binding cassette, subfamily F, member 3
MRLALARALMAPSELLLLDEPTNHLDLDAMLWLERWLGAYQGTVLLISHDTEFLDAVAQTILHFDQGKLNRYKGGYQDFVLQRAERLRQTTIAYERQTREAARLQGFIDRFKAKASKAKQAQSRVKALARMEQLAPIHAESGIDIRIPSPDEMPDPLLVLDDMQAGYTDDAGTSHSHPTKRQADGPRRRSHRHPRASMAPAKARSSKHWPVSWRFRREAERPRAGLKLAISHSTN